MLRKLSAILILIVCLMGCSKSERAPANLAEQPALTQERERSPGDSPVKDTGELVLTELEFPSPEPGTVAEQLPLDYLAQARNCETEHYLLGPQDQIAVEVSGQNDYKLLREPEISYDGTFRFDFIGTVQAEGKSTFDLEKTIRERLARDFLVDPKVRVSVKKHLSHKVFLSGDVNRGGQFTLKGECQWLSKIIMEAGGLSGNFNKNAFIISINLDDDTRPLYFKVVDLYQLFIEGKKSNDVLIYDKYIVQIYSKGTNPLGIKNSIFIFGEVGNQGMFPYTDDLTVLAAILMHAGGFSKGAKKGKTQVLRNIEGKVNKIIVDLDEVMQGKKSQDITLEPGDIIRVPRTFF
ncbi:polysaccharide biosynthesis/export family protein [candidate division CSSED10-310 bacterium]|uniref:Polysaccharide biosynthesis/export family protein n=1 Tax=candidate division CSSED10-310 bacterium TaxID=2855610 RepID=A0ABV6Z1B6_UNCC1